MFKREADWSWLIFTSKPVKLKIQLKNVWGNVARWNIWFKQYVNGQSEKNYGFYFLENFREFERIFSSLETLLI